MNADKRRLIGVDGHWQILDVQLVGAALTRAMNSFVKAFVDVDHDNVNIEAVFQVLFVRGQNAFQLFSGVIRGPVGGETDIGSGIEVVSRGKNGEHINMRGIQEGHHHRSELVSFREAVSLDKVFRVAFDPDGAGLDHGLFRNLLDGDIDSSLNVVATNLSMHGVLNLEVDAKVIQVIWQINASLHRDHSSVGIQVKQSAPFGRIGESECFAGQIPVIGVSDVDSSNGRIRSSPLIVVDENLAEAERHGVVVDVAHNQLKIRYGA